MFEFLEGILDEKAPGHVALNCNGVGYLLFIPLNCFHVLPQAGVLTRFYTSFIVREDSHRLFGFTERAERDLFNTLKDISGIGPKTALALIGHLDRHQFLDAIHSSNARLIAQVPGIGKKTAERLIVELRDKKINSPLPSTTIDLSPEDQLRLDAISALLNLGYSQQQSERAIAKTMKRGDETYDLPLLITRSLKEM